MRILSQDSRRLAVESATFGLGYTAVLIWSGSALVASFTDGEANPYWPAIPHLRTDTLGVICFAVAIVTLCTSRYLQLKRRGSGAPARPASRTSGVLAVQAVAEIAVVLGTALVAYLSLNAFTHPETLRLQLTHLWPWPSEGTVRVIGLAFVLAGATTSRYLRAGAPRPGQPVAIAEEASAATSGVASLHS
ncbi:MAG TPA: hypothetical protein VMG38_24740 [Trebonia sp.]|nr:hypothetical protein [Trebonia sp.]